MPACAAIPNGHPLASDVARIMSADARAVLERLAGTDLIARGAVTIISVEAIRERSGARWPRRRDDVWDYLRRRCDEHLSFQDLRQRVNETDFLIAMPAEEGLAAQAISLKLLEEVLVFFLGAAAPADLKLRAVTGFADGELETAEIDVAELAAVRAGRREAAGRKADPGKLTRQTPVSFVTAAGERVRVDFATERVVSLRHNATALIRVQATVTSLQTGAGIGVRDFAKLADEDIAFIDRATFEFGALFLPEHGRGQPPLVLPASFRTMGGRKGRRALLTLDGATPEQVRRGVMIELIDLDFGTPTARLAEVAAMVGQLSRGVMARVWPHRDALAPVRGTRFQGFTVDVRDLGLADYQLGLVLEALARQARGKAPALIAQGLGEASWMKRAEAAGFTHAALAGATRSQTRPDSACSA